MDTDVDDSRNRATVTEHHIENTAYTKYPGNYHNKNDEWNYEKFKNSCRVSIHSYHHGKDLEIDMCGVGPAIANAYRRIMIAEVPTMAIEHVFIYNNTSPIQDELLSHRLGLIPIKADPSKFDWRPEWHGPEFTNHSQTIAFTLRAKCEKMPDVNPEKTARREDLYTNYKVYSESLNWLPLGDQLTKFGENSIRPVHKKILIAKLSANQELDLKLHAIKGIGRDHAKFSPVATCSYRLMPDIKLLAKFTGEQAVRLRDSFSEGVIKLVGSKGEAKVANARIDSGSRNIFRHADLKDKVRCDLIKDHYIFKIESAGSIPALDILLQACDILESKCRDALKELELRRSGVDESTSMVEGV